MTTAPSPPTAPSTAWLDLLGLAVSMSYVDAGGIPTRSLQAGDPDAPVVVFLHGTSGHLEAFTRNVRAHVEAGYRVHAIDMLGHGFTGKPDHDYEIPRYVDHFESYLDACGIYRVNIAGESLGGWVGGWFTSDHPERVVSLQLIAVRGTKANPEVMERIKSSTRRAVSEDDVELTRQRLHLLMHDPAKDVSDELVEVRHRIYHQPDFIANVDHLLCLQEMPIRQRNLLREDRLERIGKVPTLIIWGRENPFGDVPEARKMHDDIPGSRLELYEGCGHWPQHEHAEKYNDMAIAFLDEHNRGGT